MKGLIIKSPHIENILSGKKVWELRGSDTKIRGPIALIKSGTKTIVGYAHLSHSFEVNEHQLKTFSHLHLAVGVTKYKKTFAWVMDNPRKLNTPIPYKHPRGAIIWVNL